MKLGAFSISLAVKDLTASKAFYEKLGFEVFHGVPEHGYLILKNETTIIGLFKDMFEKNILTFNPGWDHNAQPLESYTDIRDIQTALIQEGLALLTKAEGKNGPASLMVEDPDGNPVLIDQHV